MSLPAVSLVASPTKRRTALEVAEEIERRGFAGIACPSLGGAMSLCHSLAHATARIPFWTSIQPIYVQSAKELAVTAAYVHEVSGGRFVLGLGVSHVPMMRRYGIETSATPVRDMTDYVTALRGEVAFAGDLPPISVAAMRDGMLGTATRIADGAIWANAARSDLANQLERVPAAHREGFRLANMIPTVISEDLDAARTVQRRTMTTYLTLPNYRNYWRAVGYEEEMDAVEAALAAKERDRLPSLMSDRWLDDCTVSGPAARVREVFDHVASLGITPIAVMSSTNGGQMVAIRELFDAYA